MATIDLTKGEKGEFVAIPELDMYDHPHPKVQINNRQFLPGNTYKIALSDNALAEVKRILKSYEQANIRLLRPRKDQKALQTVADHGSGGVIMDTKNEVL